MISDIALYLVQGFLELVAIIMIATTNKLNIKLITLLFVVIIDFLHLTFLLFEKWTFAKVKLTLNIHRQR